MFFLSTHYKSRSFGTPTIFHGLVVFNLTILLEFLSLYSQICVLMYEPCIYSCIRARERGSEFVLVNCLYENSVSSLLWVYVYIVRKAYRVLMVLLFALTNDHSLASLWTIARVLLPRKGGPSWAKSLKKNRSDHAFRCSLSLSPSWSHNGVFSVYVFQAHWAYNL